MILTENNKYKLENTDEVRTLAKYVCEWANLPTIKQHIDLGCSDSMWYKILSSEGYSNHRISHNQRVAAAKDIIKQEEAEELTARFRLAIETLGGSNELTQDK